MREHYKPERRASLSSLARDFLQALIMTALIGAPFVLYFWSMTP